MAVKDTNISKRIYLVAGLMFLIAVAIIIKLVTIQFIEGNYYQELAKKQTSKSFKIPANKGNIYSADGSLLATSIPNFNILFDAVAPDTKIFEEKVDSLARALSPLLQKPSNEIEDMLRRARNHTNRYLPIISNLGYNEYVRVKNFPLFNLGGNQGGIIVEQHTIREHPLGEIAERTIGYERYDEVKKQNLKVGIEGNFGQYINGTDGQVEKQKISQGQWKPIRDENEVEPKDGYDVISTIDVYIQDIAHHALIDAIIEKNAEHGCVVVMETKTGHVKAISNIGKAKDGTLYETINYAIAESQEPGSTYKLADVMALLEDKKIDTNMIYNTYGGKIIYSGKDVKDSHKSPYDKVSLAYGFEHSLNTVMVQAVYENYKKTPWQFINHLEDWHLNKRLKLPIQGEGRPYLPLPSSKEWSKLSLPWMAFGYGVSLTPLQTLTYYNAVANNGVMVKPMFVSEIKEWNKTIKKYDTEVINPSVCSEETIKKLKVLLKNVVKKGTAKSMYSPNFSMAGKTGTAKNDYMIKGVRQMYYVSSFVGYFPTDEPKYSCIVVINKPKSADGKNYGADVAGPVFKRIAQKIFTDSPKSNDVKNINKISSKINNNYDKYYDIVENTNNLMPNLIGMNAMDAAAILGNMGLIVKVNSIGKIKHQSKEVGEVCRKGETVSITN